LLLIGPLRVRWSNILALNVRAQSEGGGEVMFLTTVFMGNYSTISIILLSTIFKMLGEFNAKLGREDIFKPTTGN
jgi:hypothetical protein